MKKVILGILIAIIAWLTVLTDPSNMLNVDAAEEFNAIKTRPKRLRWIFTHIYW